MPRRIDKRVGRARDFRQNPTDAERKRWQRLRRFTNATVHFRRQATIGPYFADFACHTTRLVIELDGGQHAESASDANRTAFLASQGYRVIRFWNHDVLGNIDGVLETIMIALEVPPTPDPSPPQERREGSVGASASGSPPPTRPSRGGEGSRVGGAMPGTIDNRDMSQTREDR